MRDFYNEQVEYYWYSITNLFYFLMYVETPASTSDGTLEICKNSNGNRNFKLYFDGSFNFCIGDFSNLASGNTWRRTDLSINWSSANIRIGITTQSQRLCVNGFVYMNRNTTINVVLFLKSNVRHKSIDHVYRLYYYTNEIYCCCCCGDDATGHVFMNRFRNYLKFKNR
jgi:hypothetical protein